MVLLADPGPPPAAHIDHNRPSLYSARSTWAGEFSQAILQLGSKLPTDAWQFYIQIAGRSQTAGSWKTYQTNYTSAFGSALLLVTDLGGKLMHVVYKRTLLGR
jgi:hypothetical protein